MAGLRLLIRHAFPHEAGKIQVRFARGHAGRRGDVSQRGGPLRGQQSTNDAKANFDRPDPARRAGAPLSAVAFMGRDYRRPEADGLAAVPAAAPGRRISGWR